MALLNTIVKVVRKLEEVNKSVKQARWAEGTGRWRFYPRVDLACRRIQGESVQLGLGGAMGNLGKEIGWGWVARGEGVGQIRVFWTNRNLTFCGREITNHDIEF